MSGEVNTEKTQQGRIQSATHLAAIEVSLGSLLHGLKVPFGGNLLSLNQGLFFCDYLNSNPTGSRWQKAQALFEISVVVACLKSLSPAGQKLGPMVSITMQGVLFSLGILFLGAQKLGQCLAMGLLSLWSFIQPAITFIFIFGFDLQRIFKLIDPDLARSVILSIVLVKILLGWALVFWGQPLIEKIKLKKFNSHGFGLSKNPQLKSKSTFLLALRDLLRPLFLISFFLVLISLYLTESSWSQIFWISLRPLGLAFLLFYLLRSPWFIELIFKITDRFIWTKKVRRLAEEALKNGVETARPHDRGNEPKGESN
ncbi:MAG: hypothetical protein ACK5V3_03420 [Bdellovibrionales bacterium]